MTPPDLPNGTSVRQQDVPSYDDKQRGAVLTRCLRCLREFYMTKVEAWCVACREGR